MFGLHYLRVGIQCLSTWLSNGRTLIKTGCAAVVKSPGERPVSGSDFGIQLPFIILSEVLPSGLSNAHGFQPRDFFPVEAAQACGHGCTASHRHRPSIPPAGIACETIRSSPRRWPGGSAGPWVQPEDYVCGTCGLKWCAKNCAHRQAGQGIPVERARPGSNA